MTNDEAPPAPLIDNSLRSSATSDRFKSIESQLLLPDRYSVLNFDPQEESEFWGRLYISGFPSSMQYLRGEFGYGAPQRAVKLVLADPINMCDEVTGLAVLNNIDAI